MKQLFINNAKTTAAISIASTDMNITVAAGTGGKFPSPVPGQEYFIVTLELGGVVEIVRCTSRSGDTLTLDTRGMEGTLPASFAVGAAVESRLTAATLNSLVSASGTLITFPSLDSLLPPSVLELPACVCYSLDTSGNPILALEASISSWRFSTHPNVVVVGSVTGTGTTTQIASAAIGTLLVGLIPGQYVIQFTSGALIGMARLVTTSSSNVLAWTTPMPSAPLVGDTFEIYEDTASLLKAESATRAAADAKAVQETSATGSALLPAGTTAQRDVTPVFGATRANSDLTQTEWWNGTAWAPMGGGATGAIGNYVFFENDMTVTANYTLTANKNAMTAGPVTINTGVIVTVPSGATWSIV
jgi:hypothetical protein